MRYYVVCVFALIAMLNASLAASSITAYDNQTVYATTNHVFYNDEVAQGFVRLNEGFTVMPPHACANLDLLFSVSGSIDLRETSTIRLLKDLEFDSGVTITTGGNIDGRGHTLLLNGDFKIPAGKVLHFNGDTIIDARGHEIVIGEDAEIFIDTNVTLTIANATIKNTRNAPTYPAIRCAALTSKLALDNVVLAPVGDFLFEQGQLFVHNDVMITGTSAFVYHSPMPSFITKNSCLYFDSNVTLSVAPATFTDAPYTLKNTYTDNNFIKMADETSCLFLNGCTLQTTNTGLRLTQGMILCDSRVQFKTNPMLMISIAQQALQSYGTYVYSVNWSPDGNFLAVGGSSPTSGKELQIYRLTGSSLSSVVQIDYGEAIYSVNWSPDGRFLAIGGGNPTGGNEVRVYSFTGSSLSLVAQIYYGSTIFDAIYSVNWSPDGHFLAIGGRKIGSYYEVQIYRFTGSSFSFVTQINYSSTYRWWFSVDWSPDGRFLAIGRGYLEGGEQYAVQIYSFNGTSLSLVDQVDYGFTICSVNWSPDGRFLAVGGNDPMGSDGIKIYRFAGSSLSLAAHTNYGSFLYSVNWSSDGRYLAVGGAFQASGNEVQVYSFNGYALSSVAQSNYGDYVFSVNWSPDGRYLAIGGYGPAAGHEELEVYLVNYAKDTNSQALTDGIVFGDSAKGSNYDAHLRLKPGASLNLIGKMLYDCVDANSEPLPG
jgi:WD40 repeat protein